MMNLQVMLLECQRSFDRKYKNFNNIFIFYKSNEVSIIYFRKILNINAVFQVSIFSIVFHF